MRSTLLLLLASTGLALAGAATVPVGRFSAGDLDGWQSKTFRGETLYRIVEHGGRKVLQADSHAGASGLYREMRVDLTRTPFLRWSWSVDHVLESVDERSKGGDDYPARVYVVVSGGAAFWRTRSLVYVWSSSEPVGSTWHNAYTSNARVIAVRSGQPGAWQQERRDVRADFRRLFGDDIEALDAVAIMTDTDNSGQSARAWYGDISFSAE